MAANTPILFTYSTYTVTTLCSTSSLNALLHKPQTDMPATTNNGGYTNNASHTLPCTSRENFALQ
eukprot:scaffold143898_cov23-Tisochrysis_lutea.AAC.1